MRLVEPYDSHVSQGPVPVCMLAPHEKRRWVIWRDSRLVHILLAIITLGHWVVLALGK